MLGLIDGKDADAQATRVQEWLVEDGVPARIVRAGAGGELGAEALAAVRTAIAAGEIPLCSLEQAKEATTEARFRLLGALAEQLETRKVIFLSRRRGLEPQGSAPLSVVNLAADYDHLTAPGGGLSRRQGSLLRQVKLLLERVPHRMSATVVNPLHLLRELFTVSGSGTLIRRGSRIETHAGWNAADRERLTALFRSAFGRSLRPGFFDEPVERVYHEEGYLGAAVMRQTPVGTYLTKFAVERQAQGEGLGTELWSLITRDFPAFFWRSRPENPIAPWYVKQCDGIFRTPAWHVFWRGLTIDAVEPAVRYALAARSDFG
jgi:acetylglutamate kinase